MPSCCAENPLELQNKATCALQDKRMTQKRIAEVNKWFEDSLCDLLNLDRVMPPIFVSANSGLNDYLNGVERVVSFDTKAYGEEKMEVVQSLAKWKRSYLGHLKYNPGEGIVGDLRAIRRDEELSPIHSIYVTQWDWEKVIKREQRTLEYLKKTVQSLYCVIKETEAKVQGRFGTCPPRLPSEITFVTAEELEAQHPDKTPKEREDIITKQYKAVFLIGIGGKLPINGEYHDGRACDYDDWSLNGDILLWHPTLDRAFEISSMGIRVDSEALKIQAAERGEEKLLERDFHKMVLNDELPLTIGGGIGQCRISMYFLQASNIEDVMPIYTLNRK